MTSNTNQDYVVSRIEEDQGTLQARFRELGYLYIKNYVPAGQCDGLLDDVLDALHPYITADSSSRLPQLKGDPFFETDPVWDAVYPNLF